MIGGKLLVATPKLDDPNFARSVLLILDHSEDGAIGLVLNKPMHVPVSEILEPWQPVADLAPPGFVFRGGPVSPDAVIGLGKLASDDPGETTLLQALPRVSTVDLALAPEEQPRLLLGARLYSGYAGWSQGQLETEIEEGAWFVMDGFADDVFNEKPQHLWHDVLQRQGGRMALLASYPPNPSLN